LLDNIHLELVPNFQSSQHGWRHKVLFDFLKGLSLFCPPSELLLMFELN
jgi:hypothetical protein